MGGSSTSATKRSPASPPSAKGSVRSGSPGEIHSVVKELAERHGIHPSKALGQHFLTDPNLARAIVADASVGPEDRVLEIGAGLGAITVALAETGCRVLAVEFDRSVVPALREAVAGAANVDVAEIDATHADWETLLGRGPWAMVSNLPYNVSVPLVLELLERVPAIERYLVTVQREVGDRFVAGAGEDAYGPVSLRVAYRAEARIVRRVPATVFWPRPKVDSVLVRLVPHPPPVGVDPIALFRVVEEAFTERRKTIANALRRLGLGLADANRICRASGIEPSVRPERLGLEGFAQIASSLLVEGWRP